MTFYDEIKELKKGNHNFYVDFEGSPDGYQYGVYDDEDRLIDIFYQDDFGAFAVSEIEKRYENLFGKIK